MFMFKWNYKDIRVILYHIICPDNDWIGLWEIGDDTTPSLLKDNI